MVCLLFLEHRDDYLWLNKLNKADRHLENRSSLFLKQLNIGDDATSSDALLYVAIAGPEI